MGILNVTPDSFAEAERTIDPGRAIEAGLRLVAEGADILDVGGESTRPGAEPLDAEEEVRRVVPVVRGLASQMAVPISVDTYKARVASESIEAGAEIVNDISGLRYDPSLGEVVATSGAGLILMHTRGRSRDMYREAVYGQVEAEVAAELGERLEAALAAGVPREQLILDPGLGFAKEAEHSYRMLARLGAVAAMNRPVLVGPSRKSFLQASAGRSQPVERDWATAAAVTAAVLFGAHIVRVHAVREMVQVVRVADRLRDELEEV